ncbi:MAG: hypothetical protein QNK37_38715 [Acidobacteriota bacterium]|nr:hypothetical protein [Acidobacteriota bacterium]
MTGNGARRERNASTIVYGKLLCQLSPINYAWGKPTQHTFTGSGAADEDVEQEEPSAADEPQEESALQAEWQKEAVEAVEPAGVG